MEFKSFSFTLATVWAFRICHSGIINITLHSPWWTFYQTQSVHLINFFFGSSISCLCVYATSLWEPNRLFINEGKLYQEQTSLINTSPALPVFDLPIWFIPLQEEIGVVEGYTRSSEGTLHEKIAKLWSSCWWGSVAALGPFHCVSWEQLNYQSARLSL